jgi:hypothetical protein
MNRLFAAIVCLALIACCLPENGLAQSSDEAATRDDVILYLRTMRTHDLMQRTMRVQVDAMHALMRDQIMKDKGSLPPNFDTKFKNETDDLLKNMPLDEIVDAMIPAYQKHFTKGDIQAMTAFYVSPVGQKILEELPAVLQEGNQAAMPMLSKYLSDWQARMKKDLEESQEKPAGKSAPEATGPK